MKKFLFLLLFAPYILTASILYDNIDANKAYQKSKEGTVLIDVRTIKEYQSLHPKGAVNVPVYFEKNGERVLNEGFADAVEKSLDDSDRPVIVICRTGSRTKDAAQILVDEGFSQVYNVTDGFANDWLKQDLPVE